MNGFMSRMLHPNDYDSMELLQSIFNHSDTKTTKHYIGLTKKKIDQYYDDMGDFFNEYIVEGKEYTDVASKPVIQIETNDLRELLKQAYQLGTENANESNPSVHIEALNSLLEKVESLVK